MPATREDFRPLRQCLFSRTVPCSFGSGITGRLAAARTSAPDPTRQGIGTMLVVASQECQASAPAVRSGLSDLAKAKVHPADSRPGCRLSSITRAS